MGGVVRRHGVLGGLYLTQGIAYGFAGFVLFPTLAAHDVSLGAQAGVLAAGSLPWVFKLAFAPLLDRLVGHRTWDPRRVACATQLLVAVSLVVVTLGGDVVANLEWFAGAWFVHNVMLAVQDATVDTLAIDILPDSERGLGNGVMLGGRHLAANVVAPRLLGVGVVAASLEAAIWLEATVLVALAVVPLFAPWKPEPVVERLRDPFGARVRAAFAGPGVRFTCIVAGVVFFADIVTSTASANFMVQHLGWDPLEIGHRLGPANMVAGLAGYAIASAVADRLGHARTAALGCVGLGLTWAIFSRFEPYWGNPNTIVSMVVAQAVFTSLLYVGLHAALMDRTDPRVRATQFVVFMGLLNLPRIYTAAVAPAILAALDYAGLYFAAGVFQIAVALLVIRLRPSGPKASA